jgi:hypothetical protein
MQYIFFKCFLVCYLARFFEIAVMIFFDSYLCGPLMAAASSVNFEAGTPP